jgi:hypothetical protein
MRRGNKARRASQSNISLIAGIRNRSDSLMEAQGDKTPLPRNVENTP